MTSADNVKRLRDDVKKTQKEITKAKVLAEKFGGKENTEIKGIDTRKGAENLNEDLVTENIRLTEENADLTQKVETLTETVILMEKRITLLEDQIR